MIADTMKRTEEFGMQKLPNLEGRVKLTLHNSLTGSDKVIEGKNIVTNAVRDIFARNILGGLNYASPMPLALSFYAGVLVYKNPHSSLSADNYFLAGDDVNPVTAHAGDEAPESSTIINEDLKRGSPLNVLKTANSIKFSWSWNEQQGNGDIGALSLTHKDTGNAGTGSTSSAFQNYIPFTNLAGNLSSVEVGGKPPINNLMCQYDERNGLCYYIGDDGDYYDGHHRYSSSKVTVYIVPMAYEKAGIHDTTLPTYDYVRKFTVTTSITFYGMPAFYFDYTNKRLWLFNNKTSTANAFSQTTVYYTVIDCVNGTEIDHGTIVSDDNDLGIISTDGNQSSHAYPHIINIIKEGNYVYLPLGSTSPNVTQGQSLFRGLKKINIANQSEQSLLLNNDVQTWNKPYTKNGGIIINGDRLFNGGVGYTCRNYHFTDNDSSQASSPSWFLHEPNAVSSILYPMRAYQSSSALARKFLVSKMINTTLFNLPSVVTKTTSQSMTVEYTLTESST